MWYTGRRRSVVTAREVTEVLETVRRYYAARRSCWIYGELVLITTQRRCSRLGSTKRVKVFERTELKTVSRERAEKSSTAKGTKYYEGFPGQDFLTCYFVPLVVNVVS